MNEKAIWDFLFTKLRNPYGTAALMGNLFAESSLSPLCVTGGKINSVREYVLQVDCGEISINDFAHDGVAFGLAQWRYWSRKQALANFAWRQGKSIGDLDVQLDFLWEELQSYKTVLTALKNATDIRTPSDLVLQKYERPASMGENTCQKRAGYGQKYYDMFVSASDQKSQNATFDAVVEVTATTVNLRAGPGKEYAVVRKAVQGERFQWIATAANGWYAVVSGRRVLWCSYEFTRREPSS